MFIPKANCQGKDDQYWLITVLNSGYKLSSMDLTILLNLHVEENGILPGRQSSKEVEKRPYGLPTGRCE